MRKIIFLVGPVLLLAACGQHPDGTPLGTDPSKTEEGRAAAYATTADSTRKAKGHAVPKGAELNATTSNGTIGTPGHDVPGGTGYHGTHQ